MDIMDSQTLTTIGFLFAIAAVICAWIYYVFQIKPDDEGKAKGNGDCHVDGINCNTCGRRVPVQACTRAGAGAGPSGSSAGSTRKKQPGKVHPRTQYEPRFTHPYLLSTLKGHAGCVNQLSMSSNNHFLASVAEDRTVLVWLTKDFEGRDHRQYRVNIPFDNASQVAWSPDNKAFLIAKNEDKAIEVFKVSKKYDGTGGYNIASSLQYPKVHKAIIVGLGVAVNGRFVMSLSEDGLMVIWNLKGVVLEEKWISNTGLTISGKLSPCGRYVAGCGTFNEPFMEIYAVDIQPSGKYTPLQVRFKLPDHKLGISAFDFSVDGNKVVTMGMDSVWRLFDTTGNRVTIVRQGEIENLSTSESPVIALSHDARVVLVGSGQVIYIYSGITGNCLGEIHGVHQDPIQAITFSSNDQYFLSSGDRMIRVFRNIPGLTEKIIDLEILFQDKSTGQALKKRLKEEIRQLKLEYEALTERQ